MSKVPRWVLDTIRETTAELVRDGAAPAQALSVITLAVATVAGELVVELLPPTLKRRR